MFKRQQWEYLIRMALGRAKAVNEKIELFSLGQRSEEFNTDFYMRMRTEDYIANHTKAPIQDGLSHSLANKMI